MTTMFGLPIEFNSTSVERNIDANSTDEFTYFPPEGYALLNWGFTLFGPDGASPLQIRRAFLADDNHFSGTVVNTSDQPGGYRWVFLMVKVTA